MRYYDSLGAAGYPVSGGVSMSESFEEHLLRGSPGGVDFAVRVGSPIYAPTKGRTENWSGGSAGLAVNFHHIDDNGAETGFFDQFMHLSSHGPNGAIFMPGQDIGARSGNTGSSTGPHIHWDLRVPGGRVERQWLYFHEDPTPSRKRKTMFYNVIAASGWQYVSTAEYVRVITAEEVRHVRWNMGEPVQHATLDDFVLFCKALGIPEKAVRGLSTTNRTWSKLDTIAPSS